MVCDLTHFISSTENTPHKKPAQPKCNSIEGKPTNNGYASETRQCSQYIWNELFNYKCMSERHFHRHASKQDNYNNNLITMVLYLNFILKFQQDEHAKSQR